MFGRNRKKIVPIESEGGEQREGSDEGSEGAISLEDLGNAYAKAVESISPSEPLSVYSPVENDTEPNNSQDSLLEEETLDAPEVGDADHVPISTESVLEAILFLGTSDSKPIDGDKLQALFRNVPLEEIDEGVARLNRKYRSDSRPFEIVQEKGGYRMQLIGEMGFVRDRFYGKVKEVQLPQAAIDCLALVAYQPGITREEVEHLWGQPPSGTLNMLVRKGLLHVEKVDGKLSYFTTERFLEIVGIESVEDLPREDL